MENKIILITGATGGIGKAAATALAKQSFTVVIHGRDKNKTLTVRDEIRYLSENDRVHMLVGDLFLMRDVNRLAEEFKQRFDRLDVLINNAGGILSKVRETTAEGIEKTFAVNLIAPFLLNNLLLSHLEKSADGRIINVSSNSHSLNAKPDFNDLQLESHYDPLRAYGNAKLFLIWITQRMAQDLHQRRIQHLTANTMHPGAVKTNFGSDSNLGLVLNFIGKIARPFFRTAEQGADTLIYLATAKEVAGISGKYFIDRKAAKVSGKYYSKEREQQVWEYCSKLTGLRIPSTPNKH